MPGCSGEPVVTTLVCFVFITHEAAGALGARHSPRPRFFQGERSLHNSGQSRRENAEACLVIEERSDINRHGEPTGRANARPMTGSAKQSVDRHSGAMQSIEPGISRFPDVQLHI